ncbi:hypothetical protein [Dactylosporangium darangshiense]|uniref:hypothetical protein n=1 Tax=Dactylosporangium darangshiense TaxID=579108 RepID=UPI00363E47DE
MTTPRGLLLLAAALLALAGCGDDKAAAPPDVKHNGAAYDGMNVCTLADDEQIKAALGEGPAPRNARTPTRCARVRSTRPRATSTCS